MDRRVGPQVETAKRGRESAGPSPERTARVPVSVVLPCLNEVGSVGPCVTQAFAGLTAAGLTGEVVVVDNGSSDSSVTEAILAGARVVEERTRGYGAALRRGIQASQGYVCVMADADGTYPLEELGRIVQPVIAGEADMVLGARLASATFRTMPLLHRAVGTPLLTFLVRRVCTELDISDSQSGFRAFRRDDVLALGIRSTGMDFASELLIKASRAGLKVREVDMGYRERIGESKLNTFADGWRHLHRILLLAPHLILVGPGALLLALGGLVTAAGLAYPQGLTVGSLRWQPIFFASIAIVVGVQAILAGIVLAFHSSALDHSVARHFQFVGRPGFAVRCTVGALIASLLGLVIDGWLFLVWTAGWPVPTQGVALASLAQSLLISGVTVTAFTTVYRLVLDEFGPWAEPVVIGRADRLIVLDGRRNPEGGASHDSDIAAAK